MGIGIKMLTHPSRIGKWIGNRFEDLTGVSSAKKANQQNIEQAQIARDWEERMSNTAYQRGTADMLKAGLNPMLAYSQGGASTPATSAVSVQQEMPGGVMGAGQKLMGMNLQKQQAAQVQAQTALTQASTAKVAAETESTTIDNVLKAPDQLYAMENSADRRGKFASDAKRAEAEANEAVQRVKNLVTQWENGKQDLEQKKAIMEAVTAAAKADSMLKMLAIPEAQGGAKFYESTGETNWWGKLGMNVFRSLKEIFK
ncbi:MAG: DNA pilot protein [Arizlama microvirus]|nr:MAG: DNA pilot protein [Arizlama microvirus]